MPQTDPRVNAYISEAATFAQPILKHLRSLVHKACPSVAETVKWSAPFFEYNAAILCHMAAFKAHVAFGFWHRDMRALLEKDLGKAENAMGHFGRIASLADLPSDQQMLRYLKQAMKINESGAPANPRPKATGKAKPESKEPDDFSAALKKNKTAAKNFAAFSPSARREYIAWILDAKRDETRASRIATTVEWVSEGKQRHWKYQK